MKTWEVYKIALENPKAKFTKANSLLTYSFETGRPVFHGRCGKQDSGDLLKVDEDWELVREPVDFMTAVNSGKMIKGPHDNAFHEVKCQLVGVLTLNEVNGKWLVE